MVFYRYLPLDCISIHHEGMEEKGSVLECVTSCEFLAEVMQDFFVEDAGEYPEGKIIQAYYRVNIPAGTLVIPWAAVTVHQESAGYIFDDKYTAGVDDATKKKTIPLQ